VAYRFHPFFDRNITVLRVLRRGEVPSVVARIERVDRNSEDEELRINIPCWMIDEMACKTCNGQTQQGRIVIDALRRLRAVVDSGLMVVKGDCHETETTTCGNVAPKATDP